MKRSSELPSLPQSPSQIHSDLYQMVLQNKHFPPIMQNPSWTLAAPFKDERQYRTPSECIGNNYSPRARHLKITQLQRKHTHSLSVRCSASTKKRPRLTDIPHSRYHTLTAGHRKVDTPGSRPLTPKQQLDILQAQEMQEHRSHTEPTQEDFERYMYYITEGIQKDVLAPQPPQHVSNILQLLPACSSEDETQTRHAGLLEEVARDYDFSIRKSIVDYILEDHKERERLSISSVPRSFPQRVIRAPVPWNQNYRDAHIWNTQHLFTVNPMMLHLQELWINNFSDLRFVCLDDFYSVNLPLLPTEFQQFIHSQCQITRYKLIHKAVIGYKRCQSSISPHLIGRSATMQRWPYTEFLIVLTSEQIE
ncbi:dynein axonemal heavy chain 3-like [Trichomycterus rosablanca]|uniref:dynein axonemal heavy chain 3-like n=1 Tax=Trichomycterus rosablanca TaxID=2290929 RepID=UPI002F355B01